MIGIRSAGQWRGWNVASGSAVAEEGNDGLPITLIAPSKMGDRSLRIAGQADLLDAKSGGPLRLAQRRGHRGSLQPERELRGNDERGNDGERWPATGR